MQQSETVENIFSRAWTLLTKNPVILVPGIVVGIAVGIIAFLVTPRYVSYSGGDPTAALGSVGHAFAAGAIMLVVGVLAYLVTQAYTVGMAGAAWRNGTTTLADGAAAFQQDAGKLLGALLLLAVIGAVLAVITFGIGWLVFLFFAIYTIPAVVLSNLPATGALSQSFSIATKRFVPTLIIVVLVFVIGLCVGLLTLPLRIIPLIGPLIANVITQAVVAYTTLVIVGEYLVSRNAPDITPPTSAV